MNVVVGLHQLQARITQAHRGVKPFERLGPVAPLRADRGVRVRPDIAKRCLHFRKLGLRIRVPAEAVVGECQAILTPPTARVGRA
jgi:hypothetical protein